MMDCDTTGIEPDFSLVKFKKLVGGGSMQIVNQTIPRALRKLGYTEETDRGDRRVHRRARPRHRRPRPASPSTTRSSTCAMGERAIAPMGHVRMMAAAQPFLSGAISKTVNLPETATVEEIEDVYFQGWKLGLKALAVYRDNCKVGQPLSDAKGTSRDNGVEGRRPPRPRRSSSTGPTRKRLPKTRPARTTSFTVGGAEGYMTAGVLPRRRRSARSSSRSRQAGLDPGRRDGRLLDRDLDRPAVRRAAGDLRLEVHQHALRAGRPHRRPGRPDGAVDHGLHLPPPGAGLPALRDRARRSASTPPTSGPRQLETGSYERRGVETEDDASRAELETLAQSAPVDRGAERRGRESPRRRRSRRRPRVRTPRPSCSRRSPGTASDAPLCMTCGTKMRPAGSCYVCEGCGSTSGCS